MASATSSSARSQLGTVACRFLLLGIAWLWPSASLAGSAEVWTEARNALAEGMFLESGLGDFAGACQHYERGLALDDLEPELEAELLIRLSAGREMLGDLDSASAILLLSSLPFSGGALARRRHGHFSQ